MNKRKIGDVRKPGRPKDDNDLRDVILDQSELEFAKSGFAGTRVRDIAQAAGVNQALIRYYFGSKEDLFKQVFLRRGQSLSIARHDFLNSLLLENPSPSVREIISAYLRPQWEMKQSGVNGAAFVRLQGRLHAESAEYALRLRHEIYDQSLKEYIDALSGALPDIPRKIIGVRVAFLVGTYIFMLNDAGRIEDMTDGEIKSIAHDEMFDELVQFLTAGISAPLSKIN